ncbi:MAG: asparagine synthase (glutamine-hydrolyzing) [Cytophagaceae bacterium]|nr:asparagine synthase (glutamine-hydrolyzing) [Cytophagaceae bacterium]
MCGITAVINKSHISAQFLVQANAIVAHRGPDDEGFLLWNKEVGLQRFSGHDTDKKSISHHELLPFSLEENSWKVGLGHRRLSILDLSPAGHQPMLEEEDLALTYNGEIFNYLEIRAELLQLGHVFQTSTDTEVILKAWKEWGAAALHKFNGMFAFVLLDIRAQKLYAVRDRFGVKPVYYTNTPSYTAFASEVKQLRLLPHYTFKLNEQITYDYLRYGMLDHTVETFEEDIFQLAPGHYMEVDLQSHQHDIHRWYHLAPRSWSGTEDEAITQFASLLKDSVRLRMRSDVPIGSALSGGLDSSTIISLMREVLNEEDLKEHTIKTITSCSIDKRYDEWEYAEEIIKCVNAEPHKVFPSFEKLQQEIDQLIWHMDYPFSSTSQFSQWCVFEEAKRNHLPVMINGQGADEQLAGYAGNDMSMYIGLMSKGMFLELFKELKAFKKYNGKWPVGFILGAIQHKLPKGLINLLPDRYRVFKQHVPSWLNNKKLKERFAWPNSLKDSLYNQVTQDPLPSLLRYEDRTSMAFSIESRVPFMDHRLIEFTLGLPEHLVYRRGERKYILRKAFKDIVPTKILQRRDKMGFVSAEERWLKEEGKDWFERMIAQANTERAGFIKKEAALDYLHQIQKEARAFNFDPWRIICFSEWLGQVSGNKTSTVKNSSTI